MQGRDTRFPSPPTADGQCLNRHDGPYPQGPMRIKGASPMLAAKAFSTAANPATTRPLWWPLGVLIIFLSLRIVLDTWWLSEFRRGYPLNTDETAYVSIALEDTHGLET